MSSPTQRVFFALWPAAAVSDALVGLQRGLAQQVSGRLVPAKNIHLTLAFIGEVDRPRLDCLLALAATMPQLTATLQLDTIGAWRRSGVVWAGSSDWPAVLLEWVAMLNVRLRQAGFAQEARAFSPHVTLLRSARVREPLPARMAPIAWAVSGFALVASQPGVSGGVYRTLWSSEQGAA